MRSYVINRYVNCWPGLERDPQTRPLGNFNFSTYSRGPAPDGSNNRLFSQKGRTLELNDLLPGYTKINKIFNFFFESRLPKVS